MEKKSMNGYLYLMPALIVILLFTIYPLIRAFIMSFMEDYNMINGTYASVGFSNYVSIFKDKYFIKALTNTGIYVAFVVPCSIALSLLIAVLLNSKIKFQGFFQTLYFLPYVTSVIAIGIVWRWIFNEHYGLLNQILSWFGIKAIPWLNKKQYALPALIIFSIWKSMAFDILIFLAGLQTISPDLYNAAKVDSTPKWRVFTKITLPGIMPMVSYALVMGMINAFKVYNEVYSLFASKADPANSAITDDYYLYDKFYNQYEYGEASASAVVLFGIILVLTFVQRKLTGRKDG